MTVIQCIEQNFLSLFPSILDNPKVDLEFEDILDTDNKLIDEFDALKERFEFLTKHYPAWFKNQ